MPFAFGNPFSPFGFTLPTFHFGTRRDDFLNGTDGTDFFLGRRGDDVIRGGAGNDIIMGGKGFDTAQYDGAVEDYQISPLWGSSRKSLIVASRDGADVSDAGRDVIKQVEALYFAADDYTLYLDGTNNAVLARDDAFEAGENEVLEISAADLTANDSEYDGDSILVTSVDATSALGAAVNLVGGVVRYDPGTTFDALKEGAQVADRFTYIVDDGKGGTASAEVTITITGENDAPMLTLTDAVDVAENGTSVAAGISATDVDSDTLTFSLSGVDAALFEIDANTGALRFAAAPDFEAPADDGGDNIYDLTVTVTDDLGASDSADLTVSVTDVAEAGLITARINEIHYDNAGTDQGEFIEIRTAAGDDVSAARLELVNGSNGTVYFIGALFDAEMTTDGTWDYFVFDRPTNGIQNGAPDGIVLSNGGEVIEFLSYEGTFEATEGTAAGMTSADIGVAEGSSTETGLSLQREEDGTWTGPRTNTSGADNTAPVVLADIRINELHYDNSGGDVGEFVELRVEKDGDVSGVLLELVNGSNGTVYNSFTAADMTMTTDGVWDYYVLDLPSNGLQNGAPDGLALSNSGTLVEFISYEGSFEAVQGAATGVTAMDIGVQETSSTDIGQSLQRAEDGTWFGPEARTAGRSNVPAPAIAINEIAVSTTSTDWEFFELFGAPGTSLDGLSLLQVSGDGTILSNIDLSGQSLNSDGFFLAASPEAEADLGAVPDLGFPNNTFNNQSSTYVLAEGSAAFTEGLDLDAENDGVIDAGFGLTIFDSVAVIADDNPLVYSGNIVGPDGSFLAPGAKRTVDGDGVFVATAFSDAGDYTPGSTNTPAPPTEITLISAVQGSGDGGSMAGETVTVSAVVTKLAQGGFFLQEEDSDADADLTTSEGVFVFYGGGTAVTLGNLVALTGTVTEFFGETQIGSVSSLEIVADMVDTPTASEILLNRAAAPDYEALEGMLVTVSSGEPDPLTIITNFNFDRFGQVVISAGNQYQPTQLFDAQTEADMVAATAEGNANSSLLLDDGVSSQNPDEFLYVPGGPGDNGNGYLDSGDDFGDAGSTLRLGTELDAPVDGVVRYSFGNYSVEVAGQISVDETTNSGARMAAPDDVGGTLQVASVNVLNYFTTIDAPGAGSGPNGLDPRGADTADELARQTEKLVAQISATGAEVLALQEIENGGFGAGSAIQTLVDELNADATASGSGAVYAAANPTIGAADGFIGTDAITTGIIYDSSAVTLLHTDYIVFAENTAAATFALADVLNAVVGSGDQVDDLQRNRPSVAATFEDNETGEIFTVASSHFKSKGDSNLADLAEAAQFYLNGGGTEITQSDIDALRADPNFDQGDGQGFWNAVRAEAAEELNSWISGTYNGGGVSNYLLLGDLNAYAQEDPVQTLRDDGGLIDLIDAFIGQDEAYSFVFDGQRGTLDQGLASSEMAPFITDVTEWHVNADEPDLINYDTSFKNPLFYNDGVYAASDHDPLIVGLDFTIDLV